MKLASSHISAIFPSLQRAMPIAVYSTVFPVAGTPQENSLMGAVQCGPENDFVPLSHDILDRMAKIRECRRQGFTGQPFPSA